MKDPLLANVNEEEDADSMLSPSDTNPIPTGLMPGAFRAFYNDQRCVETKKKTAYLILILADFQNKHNREEHAKHIDASTATPPTLLTPEAYIKISEPFASFMESGKGSIRNLVVSKQEVADELKRRYPESRTNHKNKTKDELMEMLLKFPIADTGDIEYVREEQSRISTVIENLLANSHPDKNDPEESSRANKMVRLRFIVILTTNERVLAAYLRSTDGKTAKDIDYQNTDKAPPSWKTLLCELFNDKSEEVHTKIFHSLHDDFRESINCDVGDYVLTEDKCADIMSSMKKKVRKITNDYNLSGNGSDMAKFDDDSEDEDSDGGEDTSEMRGRFNKERAIRRAARRDLDPTLIDGDDRRSFLRGNR